MLDLKSPKAAYWMLSTTSFFLACNHVIGRSVHEDIPPLGLSFWRWMVGVLILLPFVLPSLKRSLPYYRQHFGTLLAMGFMMVGSTSLILVALNYTTAINTSLINVIQPVLTVLLAALFISERLTHLKMFGIVISIVGVVIMITKADWRVLAGLSFNGGDLIALVAMCGFAGYTLTLRKLPKELNGSERLFAIAGLGCLLLLPFYLWESMTYATVPVTGNTALIVFCLALLVSVLGNAMWNSGIMIIGPSKATMFINLIPLFGAIMAVAFLGETLRGFHFIGGIMVCAGIMFVLREKPARQQ